ncbi:hypothetical protein L0U88_00790 [Flavihumibacter sp. RY-1]|uniref:YD repeat-containing protein n=1 Tax=Flavihumibacter fluminis TaxID=2909236 RepID=A0ABS9BCG3_9BACT|nr:hypothetical protein [Flavihumibacter fluminis]MCF1713162.1 hypothetical protein [Flavihumibacter fluminis]
MKKLPLFLCLFVLITVSACQKDDPVPAPQPQDFPIPNTGELVRSIQWSNGTLALLQYNADSSLKQINYSLLNSVGSTIFEWEGGKMKGMYDNRSLYKNTYHYDGNRVSYYINTTRDFVSATSYKMEYHYNANGQVSKLNYYSSNEAGSTLKTATTYEYNASGELSKAITSSGNSIITHTIDSYSDSADFNPLLFIEVGLYEYYTLYNLAVFSSLKKYPAKITRTIKTGTNAAYVDRIVEHVCDITNRRINKITSHSNYPSNPQYNSSLEAVFTYD